MPHFGDLYPPKNDLQVYHLLSYGAAGPGKCHVSLVITNFKKLVASSLCCFLNVPLIDLIPQILNLVSVVHHISSEIYKSYGTFEFAESECKSLDLEVVNVNGLTTFFTTRCLLFSFKRAREMDGVFKSYFTNK